MISERAEFYRISSNYLRIIISFTIGLILIRTLVNIDNQAIGIYSLVVIGAGVSTILRELLRIALVPVLTKKWTTFHNSLSKNDEESFHSSFAAAFVVSFIIAVFGFAILLYFSSAVEHFSIESDWLNTAYWFIIFRSIQTILIVGLAPIQIIILAMQRHISANILIIMERVAEFGGLLIAIITIGSENGPETIILFGALTTLFLALVYLTAFIRMIQINRALLPRFGKANLEAFNEFRAALGWSAALVFSMALYFRFDVFFVNMMFGAAATVIFGIAIQLTSYVAQLTMGLVTGLDAVFARALNTKQSNEQRELKRQEIMARSTNLQGIIVFLSLGFLLVSARDIVTIWLGSALENSEETIPLLAFTSQILAIGIAVRSLTIGWMWMMNGEGKIGVYARWLLIFALLNPFIVWISAKLFTEFNILSVAIIFTLIQIASHGFMITLLASKTLKISFYNLLIPLFLPLIASIFATIISYYAINIYEYSNFIKLIISIVIFSVCGMTLLGRIIFLEYRKSIYNSIIK